jgi:hypothetical protein
MSTIQGQKIKRKGIQKYVGRIKESGRLERRHSSFKLCRHSPDFTSHNLKRSHPFLPSFFHFTLSLFCQSRLLDRRPSLSVEQ